MRPYNTFAGSILIAVARGKLRLFGGLLSPNNPIFFLLPQKKSRILIIPLTLLPK